MALRNAYYRGMPSQNHSGSQPHRRAQLVDERAELVRVPASSNTSRTTQSIAQWTWRSRCSSCWCSCLWHSKFHKWRHDAAARRYAVTRSIARSSRWDLAATRTQSIERGRQARKRVRLARRAKLERAVRLERGASALFSGQI